MRVVASCCVLSIAIATLLACRGTPERTASEVATHEAKPEAPKVAETKPEAPKVAETKVAETKVAETKVAETKVEDAKAVGGETGSAAPERPALDIEYVPTPMKVVDKMLEVAAITKDDVVYDLGCGDGRLLVGAAQKYGARGFGFDLDPDRIAEARANVAKAKVGHLVTIEQKNLFDVDLAPATVVMLYLGAELNSRLVPQLEQLAPKSRIVSHDFYIKGYDPDDIWMLKAEHHRPPHADRKHYVYLWTAPLLRGE